MEHFDVIILGAGAAGLLCAINCAGRGRKTLVLEKSNKAGKKILMSGGGRCNFTNLQCAPENFISDNPRFCISALRQYTQNDFIDRVNRHHIAWHEKAQGQLFCDESSRQILAMLLNDCNSAGVRIITDCETRRVSASDGFSLETGCGEFRAQSLVVASGGLSIPKMGGSGFGYQLARDFGHSIIPTRPALVPFTFTGSLHDMFAELSGISVHVMASCRDQSFTDDLLFTHRGISGPAILQLSSYWHEGDSISISLLPEIDIIGLLREQKRKNPKLLLKTCLNELLSRKLVQNLEQLWWADKSNLALAEWPDQSLQAIAGHLQQWGIKPAGTEGYRTAEVTAGGVNTHELSSKTMESKLQPGLYFIGEVVDVTGHLGGFNFQWAWSSGHVAGQYA